MSIGHEQTFLDILGQSKENPAGIFEVLPKNGIKRIIKPTQGY